MGNPQHLEWLLEGVEAWNARRRVDDFQPEMDGNNIRRTFEAAGLLNETGLIPLLDANLRGADLGNADLSNALLKSADLRGAMLAGADLEASDLSWVYLQEANLCAVNAWGSNFRHADLMGADLTETNLGSADLSWAKLRGVYLWRANLGKAVLVSTDLGGADLRGSNLKGAKLEDANLRNANVKTHVYSGTVENSGDKFEYTDLSTSLGLTQPQVDVMDGDTGTILPEGLIHPPHWPDPEPAVGNEAETDASAPAHSENAQETTSPTQGLPSSLPEQATLAIVAKRSTAEIKTALTNTKL